MRICSKVYVLEVRQRQSLVLMHQSCFMFLTCVLHNFCLRESERDEIGCDDFYARKAAITLFSGWR